MSKHKAPKLVQEIEEKPAWFVSVLNRVTIGITIVCYGIIAYLAIFHFDLIKLFFTDYKQLQEFITPGLRIPLLIVFFIFAVVLAINPFAQLVPIISIVAFFYGFELSVVFGLVSFFLAVSLTMSLSRYLGHNVVKKIIGEKNWDKARILADEEGVLPFFIAYLFPVFPNAIITWIAGTTNVSIPRLATVATIAVTPGTIISALIGSGLVTENYILTGSMFVVLILIAVIMSKFRKHILNLINRNK
ncbi:MAG: TVP38/TMEM64 family protein [Candidatus Dojkabacteria bacterium]